MLARIEAGHDAERGREDEESVAVFDGMDLPCSHIEPARGLREALNALDGRLAVAVGQDERELIRFLRLLDFGNVFFFGEDLSDGGLHFGSREHHALVARARGVLESYQQIGNGVGYHSVFKVGLPGRFAHARDEAFGSRLAEAQPAHTEVAHEGALAPTTETAISRP